MSFMIEIMKVITFDSLDNSKGCVLFFVSSSNNMMNFLIFSNVEKASESIIGAFLKILLSQVLKMINKTTWIYLIGFLFTQHIS